VAEGLRLLGRSRSRWRLSLRASPLWRGPLRRLPLRRPWLRTSLGLLRRWRRLPLWRSVRPGGLRRRRLRRRRRGSLRPGLRSLRGILPRRLWRLRLRRRRRLRTALRSGRNRIRRPFDIERRSACRRRLLVGLERIVGTEGEIGMVGRRHHWNVGHCFWPKLDNAGFELRIDASEQGTDIEIEQRAISVHHAAGLGPRRQRIERALLERLHHVGARAQSCCEVRFGESARGSQVPKQLRHLSIIAGWHFVYPVNMQAPIGGVRPWACRHEARPGRHHKAGPISRYSPLTQAQQPGVCKSWRD
jgi:hypothetical protein